MMSSQAFSSQCDDAVRLLERLDEVIAASFSLHPFQTGLHLANLAAVMNEYVAMSVAFPYIQAGAVYENYRRRVASRCAPDDNVKITAAVGTFLAWDEFGGHHLILKCGANGLSKLIDVDNHFHSALLVRDVEELLQTRLPTVRPGPITRAYLDRLHEGLSTSSKNRNVANMVAFERHAMAMIKALWIGMKGVFGRSAMIGLEYFEAHIGASLDGEAAHMRITESMIEHLVPKKESNAFLEACIDAYAFNVQWCHDVIVYANKSTPKPCLVN
jgi:hypothetical protein